MQLRLPWTSRTTTRDARRLLIDGVEHQVVIARHRRARRYVLRVTPGGELRLTVPRGASVAGGLAFVARQAEWIAREVARQRQRAEAWGDGSVVLYRGERCAIRRDDGVIALGELRIGDDGSDDVRGVVEGHLRELAAAELPDRCRHLGAAHQLVPSRISVRAQRSRWGACSASGRITLNWRLIQTPRPVADYVLFHELAHLRVRNHSPEFWREVDRLCPDWREAETWLRHNGGDVL